MAKKLIFKNQNNIKPEKIFEIVCDVNIKKILVEKEEIYNLIFFEDLINYSQEEEKGIYLKKIKKK